MFKFMFLRKKVKLITVPYTPGEEDLTHIHYSFNPEGELRWSSIPFRVVGSTVIKFYLISDDKIEQWDKFIDLDPKSEFFGDVLTAGHNVDLHLINNLKTDYKKIIAEPKEIGLMEVMASDGIDSGDRPSREWPVNIAINLEMLQDILNSDGDCEIEMEEIPDLQTWNEETKKCSNVIVPKLIKNKVIIHPI